MRRNKSAVAGLAPGSEGTKPDEKGDVALKAPSKRNVNGAVRIAFEQSVTRRGHDADDLDGLARFDLTAEVFLNSHASVAAFRAGRVVARELNSLAKRIALRPEFFREHFVNDRHGRAAGLGGLGFVEGATAQDRQPDRGEVVACRRCSRPR